MWDERVWDASRAGAVQVAHADGSSLTVTWVNLDCASAGDARVLSDAEMACARSMGDLGRRERFVARKAFVRQALGRLIDGKPYGGEFVLGKFGKPGLPQPHESIGFNVSHAGDLIVAAIRSVGEVGIDIERRDRTIPPRLLDVVFNDDEQNCLSRCDDWRAAFLLGWTCKEAVLKCLGSGLLRDPRRIKVFMDNDCVRNSIAYEFSEEGDLDGTYEIIPLPWRRDYLGVIAIPCEWHRRCGGGERVPVV